MYLISKNEFECCGCSACEQVCAHGALRMEENKDGFVFPVKDTDKCTDCGLCEKVCPYNHLEEKENRSPRVFASYSKNTDERKKSSSGALFYVIARKVVELGGIVYGATLDERLQVRHVSASTAEELQQLRGSKYVQSRLDDTYREIRSHLAAGHLVYFTGVGCQVAGLKSFLMKDYPNLVTSDLVCHGVPSQKLFDEHIAYIGKKRHGKVVDYQFRDNEHQEVCESATILIRRHTLRTYRQPNYAFSPYLYSFIHAMTYRLSCYECPFAKVPRQGDITLADFWGVRKYMGQLDADNGVSLIIVNTPKGEAMLEKVGQELVMAESSVEQAAAENRNLTAPTRMPEIRRHIYQDIREKGYAEIARTLFRPADYWKLRAFHKIIDIIGLENYKRLSGLIKG